MDRNFLNEVVKGYLVDHNVYTEFNESQVNTIHEKLKNELHDLVDFLYDVDLETYNELKEKSKFEQQRIFEIYLNNLYAKDEPIEEGVLGPIGTGLDTAAGGIAKAVASLLGGFAKLPWWGQGGIGLLVFIFLFKHRKKITQRVFQTLSGIGKTSEKIGNFLKKKGRFANIRYSVIQQNTERCYRKCGITDLRKDFSLADYLNKYAGDSKSATTKAKCLSQCYVESRISEVKTLMKLYFICLKQTGTFDKIKDLSTQKFISMLMADSGASHRQHSFALGSACGEYYDIIHEGMKNINEVIEYFYADKNTQREMIMIVQKEVDQIKHDVIRMDERQLRSFTLS